MNWHQPDNRQEADQGTVSASPKKLPRRQRDRRLDFFRGMAMFIILIAHIPNDWWALWIPARFGFSDGAEMFVFCSGMASALAFGSLYRSHGFGTLLARVSFRVWQIYWAHITLFLATVVVLLAGNALLDTGVDYTRRPWIVPFLDKTDVYLPALLTLFWAGRVAHKVPEKKINALIYLVLLAIACRLLFFSAGADGPAVMP